MLPSGYTCYCAYHSLCKSQRFKLPMFLSFAYISHSSFLSPSSLSPRHQSTSAQRGSLSPLGFFHSPHPSSLPLRHALFRAQPFPQPYRDFYVFTSCLHAFLIIHALGVAYILRVYVSHFCFFDLASFVSCTHPFSNISACQRTTNVGLIDVVPPH